ncbi:MAG: DUF3833 family protein [Alphaproteobacteria bacterium]
MGDSGPALRLEEYFAGRVMADGVFQDLTGKTVRQFQVTIDGTWDGKTLTMNEDFLYSDGETERRTWLIRKTGLAGYEGRADNVVGTAKGEAEGNRLTWSYIFGLKIAGRVWNVRFTDWFHLFDDGVLINRADVSKFGVKLGQATIVFRKESQST